MENILTRKYDTEVFSKMGTKKTCGLFKVDVLSIKENMFMRKIKDGLIEWNNTRARQLANLLNLAVVIGIPRNDDETEKLKWVCENCDDLVVELLNEMEDIKARMDRGNDFVHR